MDEQTTPDLREKLAAARQKARELAVRVPAKAWVVFGLFMVAAILMALHSAFLANDSTVRLKVQHSFRAAQLSVWVDGDRAYSGKLTGTLRKRFGLIPDSMQGNLSQTIKVPSGKHQVKVRVEPEDGAAAEDVIIGEFSSDAQRTLSVVARRGDVSLNWTGTGAAEDASSPAPSQAGWFSRYAGALIATIAGSIISALTGFALKELPGHIRARQQGASPKA